MGRQLALRQRLDLALCSRRIACKPVAHVARSLSRVFKQATRVAPHRMAALPTSIAKDTSITHTTARHRVLGSLVEEASRTRETDASSLRRPPPCATAVVVAHRCHLLLVSPLLALVRGGEDSSVPVHSHLLVVLNLYRADVSPVSRVRYSVGVPRSRDVRRGPLDVRLRHSPVK